MTCTLQNFDVEKNKDKIRACAHPFKLVCTGGTLIEDVNSHKIENPGFKFKEFADINNGKIPSDLLIGLNYLNYWENFLFNKNIYIS
jgi:hypothetical protein